MSKGFQSVVLKLCTIDYCKGGIPYIFVHTKTNDMKRYLSTLIVLICLTIEGRAQLTVSPPPPGGSPSFTAIQPYGFPYSTTPGLLPSGEKAPVSCLFMEYGDGRFTTRFTTDYNPISSSGSLNALMTFRGKYDGGHPTARIISKPYTVPANSSPNPQNYLPVDKNIMISSDVKDLLEKDTIQIVLTFKKTFTGNGKILFYYNDVLSGFTPVPAMTSSYPVLNDANGIAFRQVRTYSSLVSHCANISARADLTTYGCLPFGSIPNNTSMIKRVNDVIETGYSNLVTFNVGGDLNMNSEYNVFITLLTNNNVKIAKEALTYIRAYFIPDAMSNTDPPIRYGSPNFSEMVFSTIPYDDANPTALRPHDPNYIIPKIKCLDAIKCRSNSSRFEPKVDAIDYIVHFQNDGAGPADSITVDVYFPTSKFDINSVNSIRNISANIAGKNIVGKNLQYSVRKIFRRQDRFLISREQYAIVRFILLNPFDGENKPVKVVNLIGGEAAALGNMDPSTMGEIKFSVSTQRTVPCFPAYAMIYFKTEDAVTTKVHYLKYCGDKMKCNQYFDCEGNPKGERKEVKKITDIKVQ